MLEQEERLRKIEVQQAEVLTLLRGLMDKLEQQTENNDAWRAKVDRILVGDGNGTKGHNVRLDRLEQAAERQKWMVRSILVPVALLVVEAIQGLLTGTG